MGTPPRTVGGQTTPTPSATEQLSATPQPSKSWAQLQRDVSLQALRDALAKANVSQNDADQIAQQSQLDEFHGFIWRIIHSSGPGLPVKATVVLHGSSYTSSQTVFTLDFPPNDPALLTEFTRAQDYTDNRVTVYTQGATPFIRLMSVFNPKTQAANTQQLAADQATGNIGLDS